MAKLILKFPYLKGGATHKKNTVEYMATRDGVVKNLVADTFLHDKKENYVGYISKRKGVEKVAEHGLFTSGNSEISLRKVAEEVANHEGNVWTPIISLKREDAEQTGFKVARAEPTRFWGEILFYTFVILNRRTFGYDSIVCLAIKKNFHPKTALHPQRKINGEFLVQTIEE